MLGFNALASSNGSGCPKMLGLPLAMVAATSAAAASALPLAMAALDGLAVLDTPRIMPLIKDAISTTDTTSIALNADSNTISLVVFLSSNSVAKNFLASFSSTASTNEPFKSYKN